MINFYLFWLVNKTKTKIMKNKKFKPYAFNSVKEEKTDTSNCIENSEPPENSCSYTLSDFCAKDESFKEKIRNDSGIKKIVINMVKTYKEIKQDYSYQQIKNTRKSLTYPDKGVRNNNLDNEEYNLIVHVDDIINKYHVVDLLGQGISGRVYEVYKDNDTKNRYALKIIKNKKVYLNQSLIELKIVTTLNKKFSINNYNNFHIITVYDYFFFQEHLCIVFELLNENLYQLLQHNHLQGISLNSINFIIKQILEAVEQVHRMGIIHCDIKPENILLKINIEKNKSDISVKLTDFGSSCIKNNPIFSNVQSLFYRAPEVILGIPYTQAIDIWSIGLVTIELFLGGPLLPGYSEYDELLKIIKIIGKIPDSMLMKFGKKIGNFYNFDKEKNTYILREPKEGEIFEEKENIYNNDFKVPFNISSLDDLLTMKRGSKIKGVEMNNSQSSTELITFIHFLKCMITILPEKRWTARQLLKHPFITGEKFDSFLQLEPSQFFI
jgi:dual specificity protein kinase YAK1